MRLQPLLAHRSQGEARHENGRQQPGGESIHPSLQAGEVPSLAAVTEHRGRAPAVPAYRLGQEGRDGGFEQRAVGDALDVANAAGRDVAAGSCRAPWHYMVRQSPACSKAPAAR